MFITPSEVSFILAENGNHKIYFINHKPIEIADKNFDYFKQIGFPEDKFYLFVRKYLLNISLTTFEDEKLLTPYMLDTGEKKIEKNKVPPDKRREIKNVFLKQEFIPVYFPFIPLKGFSFPFTYSVKEIQIGRAHV